MPTAQDTIRLAPVSEPGANLYNSYHFLTQVSGLYAQASQYEPEAAAGEVWRELCDGAIKDLGDLYHAWESVLGDSRTGKAPTIDKNTGEAVSRGCRRVARISGALNVWTPMWRWARVLAQCERHWQSYMRRFSAAGPTIKARLGAIDASSQARDKRLQALIAQYKLESAQAAACFKLVEQDDLFGRKTGS